jgi:hypothetical protein
MFLGFRAFPEEMMASSGGWHVSTLKKVWNQHPWEYHKTSLWISSNNLLDNKMDPPNVTSLNFGFLPDM